MKNIFLICVNYIKQHKMAFAYTAIFVISLISVLINIPSYKNFLYGQNLDYYFSSQLNPDAFLGYITHPNILGRLLLSLILLIFVKHALVVNLISIILYVGCVFSLFYISKKLTNNLIWSVISASLFAFSYISISVILVVESLPFVISVIFLSWAIYYYRCAHSNKNYNLMCLFLALYLLSSSFACLIIPLFVIGYLRTKKTLKTTITFVLVCVFSIVFSISSFANYTGNNDTYIGYVISGLLNLVSLPFSYSKDFLVDMSSLDIFWKIMIVVNTIFITYYLFSILVSFCYYFFLKERTNKTTLKYGLLLILPAILYILLMGFVKNHSIYNLLIPLAILHLFGPLIFKKANITRAFEMTGIISFTSLFASLLFTISVNRLYVNPAVNTVKEEIDVFSQYSKNNPFCFAGSNTDVKKTEYIASVAGKKDSLITVNVEDNPYYPVEDFVKYPFYSSVKDQQQIQKGINLGGDWNVGYSLDVFFYTTDTTLKIEYYSPDYYPENDLNIYINNKLINSERNWKGYSFTTFGFEESGAFVHLYMEARDVYRPHSLNPDFPDERPLAFYIVGINAN